MDLIRYALDSLDPDLSNARRIMTIGIIVVSLISLKPCKCITTNDVEKCSEMANFLEITMISTQDIFFRKLDMDLILSNAPRIVSIHKTAVSLNGQKVPKWPKRTKMAKMAKIDQNGQYGQWSRKGVPKWGQKGVPFRAPFRAPNRAR